ncbi:hypothetical protein [Sinomicrobium soli]|uniref:hypothetical protein n=1 Tax=Sinomicrobium sp. N-1-3-6 TaxID=2219864 RepID=UPI000DCE923D|nr:hypothetical protein [Sinomicrobium sp. N-1-3-6]RAV29173.1 hypothetical protein DN748_09645 [Sinomicrobium sp. N-1-3-6]
MKKTGNRYSYLLGSTLLFLCVYGFGIGFSVHAHLLSDKQHTYRDHGQSGYFSSVSKTLYFHNPPSETLLAGVSEYPVPGIKPFFAGFGFISLVCELLFHSEFRQYQNYFKTILIRHRKSDLIFPFHNFW